MNKPLSRTIMLGLVAVVLPAPFANAQSASCLASPSTVGCDEPTVTAGTTATISPTFPDPSPTCEKVTNACTFNFAVPVASQQEWSSFNQSVFVNTPGSCASVSACGSPCAAVPFHTGVATPISGVRLPPSVNFIVPDRPSDLSPTPPDTPDGGQVTGRYSYGGASVCGNQNVYATFTCHNGTFVPNPQTVGYVVVRTIGGRYRHCAAYGSTATIP